MKRTYSLRSLFLTAGLALVLLPLVALGGGLVGVAALNWNGLQQSGDTVDVVMSNVTEYTALTWDLLPKNQAEFAEGLNRLSPENRFAVEIRSLDDKVLYASPNVADGFYRAGRGFTADPNERFALVRRGGMTVGAIHLWIWPTGVFSTLGRALATGLWAAAGTIVLILAGVLWFIRRAVLQPMQALERATAAIAEGDLDFALPASQVRELDHLGKAFLTMRDRLRTALDRQQALESERRRFIAAVGHDLRTPLSSVRAFAEGLRDGLARDPEKAAHYGQVILTKTKELERLVEELFEYARLDLPGTAIHAEPVDGAAYLTAALGAFGPEAEAKSIKLTAEGPALPLTIDPELFARALGNLLSNALRHTPEGGAISLTWAPHPAGGAVITVADNGEGIPPADLPHLFTPLHRTDRSRSRRSGGAGLGLAITQRIIALHGGEIRCESAPGEGTRFIIRLP